MNVAQVYFSMMESKGVSRREAARQVCFQVGLKEGAGYASTWASESNSRPIPPAVVKEMQTRVATYVAAQLEIEISDEKALAFASMLAPKVKGI